MGGCATHWKMITKQKTRVMGRWLKSLNENKPYFEAKYYIFCILSNWYSVDNLLLSIYFKKYKWKIIWAVLRYFSFTYRRKYFLFMMTKYFGNGILFSASNKFERKVKVKQILCKNFNSLNKINCIIYKYKI